jgi:epoxyqueuosine reductase
MSTEQSANLRQEIEVQARRLGFDLVGVTTPEAPTHFEVYKNWLAAGRHGEMDYLATDRSLVRRADPRQILPECRSILVLGARYSPSVFPAQAGSPLGASAVTGKVAAYAWGADYHDVLATRLKILVSFIEAQVGAPLPNRWYTDTGPLLERELAQRAGLGWIGKNTCLINPHSGSYLFLAEILLALDLPADDPFIFDRCGRCTRCLQACPTGCILPDRTIDARRCLSYLTIELKGCMPAELRPGVGEWVFGCDICQQVCPWNVRSVASPSAPAAMREFLARPGVPQPELMQELALSGEQFSRKFTDSAVRRTRRSGYLRNVAVALGSLGFPAAVPALARALSDDPEPLVRSHAAWALGQLGGSAALRALSSAARSEIEAEVLKEIGSAQSRLSLNE